MNNTLKVYLTKAMKFCSSKEVCIFDIQKKLNDWKIEKSLHNTIIQQLISEKFIDETRYAQAFASDKFRFNNWGKRKIEFELKRKNIPQHIINQAVATIETEAYTKKIKSLISAKIKSIKDDDTYKIKLKILRYMTNKGFEPDIVSNIFDKNFKDKL
jgi:regulatory protein